MKIFFSKRQFLLIFLLGNGFILFSQSKRDTIAISNYIVKNGYIRSYTEFSSGVSDPSNYIDVITAEDSVFSVSDGIVKAFFKVQEYDFVMIESKDAWFTYGHFNFSGLKKGDRIKKGQFLGIISKTNDNEKNIVFAICYKNKDLKCLDYIELYDYLKKYKQ